jgi:hypothetical protein
MVKYFKEIYEVNKRDKQQNNKRQKSVSAQAPISLTWHNEDVPIAKLGINCNNASEALHVNGNIFVTGNIVSLGTIVSNTNTNTNNNNNNNNVELKKDDEPKIEPIIAFSARKERFPYNNENKLFKIKQFGKIDYDTNNTFHSYDGDYHIPVDGYYYIALKSIWFHVTPRVNSYRVIQIRSNDSYVLSGQSHTVLTYNYDQYFMSCAEMSKMRKNDIISVYILSSDSTEVEIDISIIKLN